MQTIIILTACVTPNAIIGNLTDPNKRRNQYIDALNWYLEKTSFDIIWAENSGETIENEISKHYLERVEFLTYIEPEECSIQNKGFKEWNIMKYVYENSKKISKAGLLIRVC